MNFSEYQGAAGRTANRSLGPRESLANWSLGLGGEVCTLLGLIGEVGLRGAGARPDILPSKVGDVVWYLNMLCAEAGVDLAAVEAAGRAQALAEARPFNDQLLALASAAGSLQEAVKHHLFHNGPLWPQIIEDGAMHLVSSLACVVAALGFTLEEAYERNLADLGERYPRGFVALTGKLIQPA